MKRNKKCQKTPKDKEKWNNQNVSAFVHQEEILNNYLFSRLKMLLFFFCFSPNLTST
jgi:hypothetical protein